MEEEIGNFSELEEKIVFLVGWINPST